MPSGQKGSAPRRKVTDESLRQEALHNQAIEPVDYEAMLGQRPEFQGFEGMEPAFIPPAAETPAPTPAPGGPPPYATAPTQGQKTTLQSLFGDMGLELPQPKNDVQVAPGALQEEIPLEALVPTSQTAVKASPDVAPPVPPEASPVGQTPVSGEPPPSDLSGLVSAARLNESDAPEDYSSPPPMVDSGPTGAPPPQTPKERESEMWAKILGRNSELTNMNHLVSDMGKAGETANAALSGRKADFGFYNSLDPRANAAETSAKHDQDMMQKARQHDEDQMMKWMMKGSGAAPGKAGAQQEDWGTFLNAFAARNPALVQSMGGIEKLTSISPKNLLALATGEARSKAFGLSMDKQKFAEVQAAIKNQNTTQRLEQAATALENVKQRYGGTAVASYDTKIADLKPLVGTLNEIERLSPGYTRGITAKVAGKSWEETAKSVDFNNPESVITVWDKIKVGLPYGIGSNFTEPQKSQLIANVKALKAMFVHPLVGSNFTESEQKRWDAILNDAVGSSPEAQAMAVDMIRRATYSKLTSQAAAVKTQLMNNPEVWDYYQERGGITNDDAVFSDLHGGGSAAPAPKEQRAGALPQKTINGVTYVKTGPNPEDWEAVE